MFGLFRQSSLKYGIHPEWAGLTISARISHPHAGEDQSDIRCFDLHFISGKTLNSVYWLEICNPGLPRLPEENPAEWDPNLSTSIIHDVIET